MPEPSVSTGAQPSAEAPTLYVCENCGLLAPMSGMQAECRPGWTHGRLMEVQKVDAPAIHAAGYEEGRAAGRDEALREVVAWLREESVASSRAHKAFGFPQAADAIEAAFPTTGEPRGQ